ncbi:MAG TPA: NrfD/PsrC family molybdoenzyme membrane anchor subunit [Gaiellaceae bacterium]
MDLSLDALPLDEPATTEAASERARRQLREAAVRPMLQKPGPVYRLLALALGAVVVLGLVAFVDQLVEGMSVNAYSDAAFWDVNIANFITVVGVAYGGAVISAVLRLTGASWRAPLVRIAEGTSVVCVLVGGAAIIPSLGRPERMWEFFTRPNFSSPLIWDALAIGTYAFASIVFFVLPLIPDLAVAERTLGERAGPLRLALWRALSRGWRGTPAQRLLLRRMTGFLAVLIIPLAVSVHSVLGWAFAITSFRPWWSEELWAPLFVIAALYSGIALVIVSLAALRHAYGLHDYITDAHFKRLGFILVPFGAAYFYMSVADFLPGAYHGQPSTAAVFRQLLVGSYAPWFWIVVVGGMVVPLLIIALPRTRRPGWIVVASALVLPTFWLNRVLMVIVPSTYDMMNGSFGAYAWTWVNASITAGAMAAVPLLIMLLFRVVPILSVAEIEQLAGEEAAEEPALGPSAVGQRERGIVVGLPQEELQ